MLSPIPASRHRRTVLVLFAGTVAAITLASAPTPARATTSEDEQSGQRFAIADPLPGPDGAQQPAIRYVVDADDRLALAGLSVGTRASGAPEGRIPIAGTLNAYVVSAVTQYGTPTATAATAAANLASVVGPYWSSVSGGRVNVTAVAGPERVDISDIFACDDLGFADDVKARAFPGGLPADATLVVIVKGPCFWAGLSVLGGDRFGDLVLLNDGDYAALLAHETGHTLGLGHSKAATCPASDSPLSQCTIIEYGDGYDTMGRPPGGIHTDDGRWLPVNPQLMDFAGWSDPSGHVTVTGPTTVTLALYQSSSGQRVATVTGIDGSSILISYATPIRFGHWAGWTGPQPQGIQIHRAWQSHSAPWHDRGLTHDSHILELPGTGPDDHTNDLTVGQSWASPAAGVGFTVESLSPDAAVVRIDQAADPAAVFAVRPADPPPPPAPGPVSDDGSSRPFYVVWDAEYRVSSGPAADQRVEVAVRWETEGADSPAITPRLTLAVNGQQELQSAATSGTVRVPLGAATITSRMELGGWHGTSADVAAVTLAERPLKLSPRRAWRPVRGSQYAGGTAWRLRRGSGVIAAPVGFADYVALVTGPGTAAGVVNARDAFGRIGPRSSQQTGTPWTHAYTGRGPLLGPVRFTVAGRGAIVDAVVTVTDR